MPAREVNAVSERCRRAYETVVSQAEKLLQLAMDSDETTLARRADVSGWNIGQHLDHMALANRAMAVGIQAILTSGGDPSSSGPTLVGRAVLFTGWIPRGRGKAPESTAPMATSADEIKDNLSGSLDATRQLGGALKEIERSRGRRDHHVFGGLTPLQWLRFMDVHTRHHLKIIRDIERATR